MENEEIYRIEEDKCLIYNSITDKDICNVFGGQEDEKFVLNILNNYPKTIEFLKQAVSFMNMVPNSKYSHNHYELCSKIDKFLKSIENEENSSSKD